jgi:hypothetical protein
MPDFFLKQGDTAPALQATLKDGAQNAVDVTGATVVFSMETAGVVKVSEAQVTITTATDGVVTYSWSAQDTDTPGNYTGEFEVTFGGGAVQTFPNTFEEKLNIIIAPEIA